MKRSTAKKTEKLSAKEPEQRPHDNSEWFDVMRATLSPYWSARIEYMSEHEAREIETESDAA